MHVDEKVLVAGQDSLMTVRHLTIRGTNFEIGRALGELAQERHGISLAKARAVPVYARARHSYFRRHYPIHWERVRGVAEALGVDPNDVRYDLTTLTYNMDLPPGIPGCSAVYYPPLSTASRGGYLSRNYDFDVGTMADVLHVPSASTEYRDSRPVMAEPYIMTWYPEDGGYASLAIHAFDMLSGTLDGINSAGLVVAILADEEAVAALGPNLEPHLGRVPQAIGLHELQVMRWLLDTCGTAEEAKQALLEVKQYYTFSPCHYIVADRDGNSFIYENSTGRNVQYVFDGSERPLIVTNFQIYRHRTRDQWPEEPFTLSTNAFWRYHVLERCVVDHDGLFTPKAIKEIHHRVNVLSMVAELGGISLQGDEALNVQARTLWHSIYDQDARSASFSFYLDEQWGRDNKRTGRDERRTGYLTMRLVV